ncbi:MAG: protein-glutamate O-methyltransferase CheR [Deltaproteobacteria bacterium]|nr:protein-glutamate O-methyltransferase CheR [Deltaproteobacteria bacterium]
MPTTSTLTTQEFELLRDYIERECGISLGVDKIYLMESRLRHLVTEYGGKNFFDLHKQATGADAAAIRQKIIDAITTNETLWFRDKSPYMLLEQVFLPLFKEKIRKGIPKIRIWSAACSTGQEPYSMAMIIKEFVEAHGEGFLNEFHFEIIATDISSQALGIARIGAYDQFTMGRGMEDKYTAKYFKQNQQYWIIEPHLKKIIQFKEFNLQGPFDSLGRFDLVFLRNVAIYFSNDSKIKLFEKIRNLLNPGGLLVLGSTESLAYYTNSFETVEFNKTVYYRNK